MRIIGMLLNTPDQGDLDLAFTEGLNIISVSDNGLFSFFKQNPVFGIYVNANDIPYSINISAATQGGNVCFINDRGKFCIKENNDSRKGNGGNKTPATQNGSLKNRLTVQELNLISLFNPELIHEKKDPVFDTEIIKSFLIKNEIKRYDSGFFSDGDNILKEKEKELVEFNRQKQLLELKQKKREKLLREVQLSERELYKLERERESILKYKSVINEIKIKTEERNKLSLKINNLKKNLIEYREIQAKSDFIEKKLKEQFPHFFQKGSDQLPDLKNIQESFNKYRDVNEQIDGFFVKKRRFLAVLFKVIQSIAIFSLISALVIILKPVTRPVLGIISGLSAVIAALLFLVSYFKIQKLRPTELLDRKKNIESDLIEILKKNQFPFDDCRTGEIYELLFQYFTDYISYRDMNSEFEDLKRTIPDSSTLNDKDKKLDQLIRNHEDAENRIMKMLEGLDESIHIRPSTDNLTETAYDLDEALEENAKEIKLKKTLILKFETEIAEHDKIENSSLSAEAALEEVIKKIDENSNIIKHISFLNQILKDASEAWVLKRIETLSCISSGYFLKLAGGVFTEKVLNELFTDFILNCGSIKNEYSDYIHNILLSVKTALYEMLSGEDLPPFFIVDPFSVNNDFAENLKKLLPELIPQMQVIIIVPENIGIFEGNLITI